MRVGSLVLASMQGLGVMAHSFYQAGVITDALVVKHRTRPDAFQYPGAQHITGGSWPSERRTVLQFCEQMDVVLALETFFYWEVIEHCRKHGVRTILIPMMECLPPAPLLPYQPDFFICPSLLDFDYFPDRSVYLPVPVEGVTWERRDRCLRFLHNAGHGGLKGRNGTRELLEAWQYVKSPATLTVRMQKDLGLNSTDSRVTIHTGTLPYEDLYTGYDCLVFPEKFNGLSLVMQEALASGILVMASARYPNTTYLPTEPLIPVAGYRRNRVSHRCVEFDEAIIEPRAIAKCVDAWYDSPVGESSDRGREYAEANSWEVLKPRYMEALTTPLVQ